MGEKRLKNLGIEVSKARAKLKEEAKQFVQEQSDDNKQEQQDMHTIAQTSSRNRSQHKGKYNEGFRFDYKEPVPVNCWRKLRKNIPLSISQKVSIVHKVLVMKEKQKDVAQEHRASIQTVCRLAKKAEKNKDFLKELLSE